jgi:hypothetical protein
MGLHTNSPQLSTTRKDSSAQIYFLSASATIWLRATDIPPIDAPAGWPEVDHLDLAGAGSNCQGNKGEKFSFQAYAVADSE